MITKSLSTAALVVVLATGCTAPPENPHGVSIASCDPALAEKLYARGAVDSIEESHRVDLSHGHEEHIVTGATLTVRAVDDVRAFEQALRCHSARSRATSAAARAHDPLLPTGWAPEITATAGAAGAVRVTVTSKHRETATDIAARARALREWSKAAAPDAPSGGT